MRHIPIIFTCAIALAATTCVSAEDLVIHEWGTFTSLQNGQGDTLGHLNVDEEALPAFVHDVMPNALERVQLLSPAMRYDKGFSVDAREVTLRLETPVIYFHPAPGAPAARVTVEVSFLGGVLSQFYPTARVRTAGEVDETGHFVVDPLGVASRSTLTWRYLQIGHDQPLPGAAPEPVAGPETTAKVWLAPRAVAAADLTGYDHEHERFLFYRGLGHRDAPVRVVAGAPDQLEIHGRAPGEAAVVAPLAIAAWWVVDIRDDGTVAFRQLPAATVGTDPHVAALSFSSAFAAADYSAGNRAALCDRMQAALCGDGLFADEARALLSTWEASYFRSPGLRLFFLVPRMWTDSVLPLRITDAWDRPLPHTLVRTLVGRIELISHRQSELLSTIAAQPGDLAWWTKALKLRFGDNPGNFQPYALLRDMIRDPAAVPGIHLPPAYAAYLALGRFRAALVLDAAQQPGMAGIKSFNAAYQIE